MEKAKDAFGELLGVERAKVVHSGGGEGPGALDGDVATGVGAGAGFKTCRRRQA